MELGWMAWTWQTATFFCVIAFFLVTMTLWEWARPGGDPRHGILGLDTTRGDRLFISLLTAAFIHLAWLGLVPETWPLWGATVVSVFVAVIYFRWA